VQTLPETDRIALTLQLHRLEASLLTDDAETIRSALEQLKANYDYLSKLYPVPLGGN
jgi:hypothetical protein